MKILFVQTGGTIDKEYEQGVEAYNFVITSPSVERILDLVKPSFEYRIVTAAKKDSMDLTDEDRRNIVMVCEQAPENAIIITHGTDTMAITAKELSRVQSKVIILTGALRPERFYNSDAMFNIGTAVGGVQTLESGVYIAMSGQLFAWDEYMKHPETGQFLHRKVQS